MNIKVKLIGSGVEGDPWRAPLPTYVLRHQNHSEGWAIVHVPDDVHGLSPADLKGEIVQDTSDGPFYPKLSDATLKKIHAHFDEKYKGNKTKFRIEQA